MQIKSYDIDFTNTVIGMAGAGTRFANALAEIETADGSTATALMTAQADSGGNRYIQDVQSENIRVLSGEIDKAELAEAINAGIDDTAPDMPEYELSYAAAEAVGETETTAKMARKRLKKGQVVRLRMNATDGRGDLQDEFGDEYYSLETARAAAIRTAKEATTPGKRSEDWTGWRVEATTNSGEVLFSVDFGKALRK